MAAELDNFRSKFPQYSDMGDAELARRLAAKYPEYKDLPSKVREPDVAMTKTAEPIANQGGYFEALKRNIAGAQAATEQSTATLAGGYPIQMDPLGSALGFLYSPVAAGANVVGEKVTEKTGSKILGGIADIGTNILAGTAIGYGGQLIRNAAQAVVKHLPGASTALRELGKSAVTNMPNSMQPKVASSDLYKAVETLNPTVKLPNFAEAADSVAAKEAELSGFGLGSRVGAVAKKSAEAAKEPVPFSIVQSIRQRIGERIGAAREAGGEGLGQFKLLYRELTKDLESGGGSGPAYELLKKANIAAKREFALGEVQDIIDSTMGRTLEAQNFTSSNFATAANKIKDLARKDQLFREGLGKENIDALVSRLEDLARLPRIPVPKGTPAGSMIVGRQMGVGGGLGAAAGAALGGPIGATIGGGMGTAAGAFVPWAISRSLQSEAGAQMLMRFLQSPGGLTPERMAAIGAYLGSVTGGPRPQSEY